jgi:hypothetical protein
MVIDCTISRLGRPCYLILALNKRVRAVKDPTNTNSESNLVETHVEARARRAVVNRLVRVLIQPLFLGDQVFFVNECVEHG